MKPVGGDYNRANNSDNSRTVTAEKSVITGDYKENAETVIYQTTIVDDDLATIVTTIGRIRPEFNNYRNPNHKPETVLRRLRQKFALIEQIVNRHGWETIPADIREKIGRERERYRELLKKHEAAAA